MCSIGSFFFLIYKTTFQRQIYIFGDFKISTEANVSTILKENIF